MVKCCDVQLEAMRVTVQRSTPELVRKAKYDTAKAATTVTTTQTEVRVCSVAGARAAAATHLQSFGASEVEKLYR